MTCGRINFKNNFLVFAVKCVIQDRALVIANWRGVKLVTVLTLCEGLVVWLVEL